MAAEDYHADFYDPPEPEDYDLGDRQRRRKMATYEKNPDELGALWLKSGAKGDYMTGEINGVKVVCFPAKPSDNGPAWRVMKSRPKDGGPSQPSREPMPEPPPSSDIGW